MALNGNIIALERFTAITEKDAGDNQVMTLRMAQFIQDITTQVNQNIPLNGAGSPETVITAEPFKFYLDTASDTLYVKKTGSGNTGWVAI